MDFVEETLIELQANYGWSQAQIERSLDLERGALNDTQNPEIIATMKIVKHFPWVIKVADRNYDPSYTRQQLLHAAGDAMHNKANKLEQEEKEKKQDGL